MVEALTVAIGIGLVISLMFGELFGITAGGMIVPGYVAVSLDRPVDVALTMAAALVTFGIVRAIASVAIVFGRRRTALTILVGYLVGATIRWYLGEGWLPTDEATVIGYIIPGLIAIWLERQGVVETFAMLVTASVVVRLALITLAIY